MSDYQKLLRLRKLASLSNAVLINSSSFSFYKHLEVKLQERVEKEFRDRTAEEACIIRDIKKNNLRCVERKIKQHRDGEFFVQIQENVREKDVHLFHKFNDKNLDLIELFIMGDALKRSGVNSVTAYLPYIPYQRQDKKDDGRVPITAKLIFDLISASMGKRLKRLVTFDLHARQEQGHFDGPLDELSAVPEFARYYRHRFREEYATERPGVMVISPDAGGAKRAEYLAGLLGTQYLVLDKKRTGHGEAETRFYLPADVKNKKVILVDDIIDSGSSLVGEYENNKPGPVQYLQSREAEVYICATHAVLSQKNGITAEERFRRAGAPVLFTDSIPPKYPGYYEENKDWMGIISLDYAMAKAFYCNQVGESISTFLDRREKVLIGKQGLDFIVKRDDSGIFDLVDETSID